MCMAMILEALCESFITYDFNTHTHTHTHKHTHLGHFTNIKKFKCKFVVVIYANRERLHTCEL